MRALPVHGRPHGADAVYLTVALVAVSTSGPLMAATAVPALAIAFWRNAMASAVLVPAVLVGFRAELRGLDRRERRLAALAGLLLALHFATWVPALTYTSVASAMSGALLLAAVFLGQTPPVLVLPAAVLLVLGLAVVIRAGTPRTSPSVPVE
jgi:drug/metabolite transporter (DMT)-like permease